jgi:hypothetical protein
MPYSLGQKLYTVRNNKVVEATVVEIRTKIEEDGTTIGEPEYRLKLDGRMTMMPGEVFDNEEEAAAKIVQSEKGRNKRWSDLLDELRKATEWTSVARSHLESVAGPYKLRLPVDMFSVHVSRNGEIWTEIPLAVLPPDLRNGFLDAVANATKDRVLDGLQ